MEIDLPNLHSESATPDRSLLFSHVQSLPILETNSSYFTDVDIARIHLICTLFAVGIEKQRGGTAAITGAKGPAFGVALGAVSCSFRREIKPYQEYEMWTRILSWDCKWLYVVTHFVKKGAVVPNVYTLYPSQAKRESWERRGSDDSVSSTDSNAQSAIFATALSKMVFKKGRMTISPKDMLRLSGLLPETMAQSQWKEESPGKLSSAVGKEVRRCPSTNLLGKAADETPYLQPLTAEGELAQRFRHDEWTHERIEGERVRGLELASLLGKQDALEETFQGETEVLGRHSDGTGVAGIVSTLAQLGGISKVQLL